MSTSKAIVAVDPAACERCGQVHQWCKGHRATTFGPNGELLPCQGRPKAGKKMCNKHGGAPGVGRPMVTGKHSRVLKGLNLKDEYEQLLGDPMLLHVTEEVALVDTRINQLLERLPDGFSPDIMLKAQAAYRDMRRGGAEGAKAMVALGELLNDGANETRGWLEIVGLVGERRKLVATQQSHIEKMNKYVQMAHVIVLCTKMAQVVARHVEDDRLQHIIADEFDRIAEGLLGPAMLRPDTE